MNSSKSGRCAYIHDVTDDDLFPNMSGEWSCLRPVLANHEYCIFHLPPREVEEALEVDNADAEVARRFHASVNGTIQSSGLSPHERKQFIGAKFGNFGLPSTAILADVGDYTIPEENAASTLIDLRGATVNGTFHWQQVALRHPLNLDRITIRDELECSGIDIVGSITAVDADINGDVRFDNANIDGSVYLENADIDGDVWFPDAVIGNTAHFGDTDISGDVWFEDADIDGIVYFQDADIDFVWFLNAEIGEATHFPKADIGGANFGNTDIGGNTWFQNAVVGDTADFENADIDGNVRFDNANIDGPVYFENADISGDAWFQGANIDGIAHFANAHIDGPAIFSRTEITQAFSLKEAIAETITIEHAIVGKVTSLAGASVGTLEVYDLRVKGDEGINLSSIQVDGDVRIGPGRPEDRRLAYRTYLDGPLDLQGARIAGTLYLQEVLLPSTANTVDLTGSTVGDCEIEQPSNPLMYDFREANIGKIDVINDDAESTFSHLRLERARFDEFDFSVDRDHFSRVNWRIHPLSSGEEQEREGTETMYLNAKNAASVQGDIQSAGEFFRYEMAFRRKTHVRNFREAVADRDLGELRTHGIRWIENTILNVLAGYGERPSRVLGASIAIIGIWAGLFWALGAATPQPGVAGDLILSLESFVTLVLKSQEDLNLLPHLLAQVEGFMGLFLVALFVYTLTQGIDR